MKKVYFKLLSEHTNLKNEPAEVKIKLIKEYEFFSDRITTDLLNELYFSLRDVKGDWISLNVVSDNHSIYATISLLSALEGENKTALQPEILTLVEDFLRPDLLSNLFLPKDNYNPIEETDQDSEQDSKQDSEGILVQIEGHSKLEEDELIKELKKKNIKYEVITNNFISTDVGASSVVCGAIIFIANAALGGIIWDVMKSGLSKVNPFSENQLDERSLENINYKKLLKDVSQRAKIATKDLMLIKKHRKDSEKIFMFRANNTIITVICDERYIIQDFRLEEREPYKINI
ncbi:hypothetical protein P4K66_13310 [Bacillus anthracis]|uniref:hypothetical protein n=1 Tax=Bacillus anthracis TaxID=1392 RepID=UPI002DBD15D7|nr:hypothetical protein [Bacillus anthracis]MEC0017445.1 hypothetical protein [Bacillus anthracis]